jgi:hypothetical protein
MSDERNYYRSLIMYLGVAEPFMLTPTAFQRRISRIRCATHAWLAALAHTIDHSHKTTMSTVAPRVSAAGNEPNRRNASVRRDSMTQVVQNLRYSAPAMCG